VSRRRASRWGFAYGWWVAATCLFIALFAAMKILLAILVQQPWYTGYEYPLAIPTHLAASALLGWVHYKNIHPGSEAGSERKEP
jgi:hypothetical protein